MHCKKDEYKNIPSTTVPKANILDTQQTMDIELDHASNLPNW
jgi:hypothetical protein